MEATQAKAEDTAATAVPAKETGTPTPQPQPEIKDAKTLLGSREVNLDDLDAVQTASKDKATQEPKAAVGGEVKTEEPAKAQAPEAPPEVTPAPETTPEPTPEPTPAPEPEPAPAKPPEAELPERFRFKDESDRLVAALKRQRPELSWADAERLVKGEPAATEVPPDPMVAATTAVDGLKAEIAGLEKKVAPEGEDEILTTPEMRNAQVQLTAKRAELVRAEIKLENAQAAIEAEQRSRADAQTKARNESKARALVEFPDAANPETPLGAAIAKRFSEMKDPNHPEHTILYADTAPERVTEIVARELGIQPKPKATPTAQPTEGKPVAPPQPKAAPVSGAKTSVPATPAEANAKKQAIDHVRSDKVTLEELDKLFGAEKGLVTAVR